MNEQLGKTYKRYAHALYRLFSWGLSVISHIKPIFHFALRVLTSEKQDVKGRVLPVHVSLGSPVQAPLGREALKRLIERSAAVGAMKECMCRAVGGCQDYPVDLGCLVLGESVLGLHPDLGRAVSRQEAMAIVDRAFYLGLTPMVIHLKSDALLWSLEHSRMLTVCFCCPCHCLIQKALAVQKRLGSSPAPISGLPGVAVRLHAARCVGCGRCAGVCTVGAMAVRGGKAEIDAAKCLACGRCAIACANGALAVEAACGANTEAELAEEYGPHTEASGAPEPEKAP